MPFSSYRLPVELRLSRAHPHPDPHAADLWSALRIPAESALPDFLLRQRWYPAKDAGKPSVQLLTLLPFSASEALRAAIAVWGVTPPGRAPLRLFVPLAVVPAATADHAAILAILQEEAGTAEPMALIDACALDEFLQAWLDLHLEAKPSAATAERLRGGRTAAMTQLGIADRADRQISRGSAEQSNTSVRVGEYAILKILRRLEDGIHPELEIGRYLAAARFPATAPLWSWLELTASDGTDRATTLSLLQGFVSNQGDGWSWMLEHLGRAARRERAAQDEIQLWVHKLALRTAELHRTFALATSEPEFLPEAVTAEDLQRWARAARDMAERVFATLEAERAKQAASERQSVANGTLQHLMAGLAAQRERVMGCIEAIEGLQPTFTRTRHHGDFHLGQVLVTAHDVVIIDFEGEPLRPLAERRAKHAVLRDVAGMVRSFSYATAAVARALPASLAEKDRAASTATLERWETEVSRRFVDDYLEAMHGVSSIPAERAQAERLLQFFLLEKALYEVVYELANRPDWVAIPIRGVMNLMRDSTDGIHRLHVMPFGAELRPDGTVRFRMWGPSHPRVSVELDHGAELLPMHSSQDGWHELVSDRAHSGTRYAYVLPGGQRVPDPASRFQPEDVHGPSEVVDPCAYVWRCPSWRGRLWEEAVVYELHVGAYTPEGSFRSIIGKLDHLATLGVTAIELMPIADFPGRRNWGYDGVCLYAPEACYGRPAELKELIDAAHERGLMVLLDVVYNHFGPEGAYIHTVAPQTFTERHKTPWGAAINTDGEHSAVVREFFIHNALYWIEEFQLDGLRLDAVHAILDESPKHFLEELAERVRAAEPQRHVHLILENEENQASLLVRQGDRTPRWYSAQWNDDVHHVLHVAATGEAQGYYADYQGDAGKLGRALAEGFAFQGEHMPYRGHARGQPSADLPPTAFVAFIQNHDQIGNRAFGERLTALVSREALRAIAAVYLLLPQIPMLFMGEEWGTSRPFQFFCDFEPQLAAAVRQGRRAEFARFPQFQDAGMRERIPDATAEATFLASKLDWAELWQPAHSGWYDWYRQLLGQRHREIVPRLSCIRRGGQFTVLGPAAAIVRWPLEDSDGVELLLEANLQDISTSGFASTPAGVLWQEGTATQNGAFGPYAVRWSIATRVGA